MPSYTNEAGDGDHIDVQIGVQYGSLPDGVNAQIGRHVDVDGETDLLAGRAERLRTARMRSARPTRGSVRNIRQGNATVGQQVDVVDGDVTLRWGD